jgi:hypothetical protein
VLAFAARVVSSVPLSFLPLSFLPFFFLPAPPLLLLL